MKNSEYLRLAGLSAMLCLLCGCPPKPTVHHRHHAGAGKNGGNHEDPEAQKRAYDRGLKHFSEENYIEAKKDWEEAIHFGRSTPLGLKAQEYLQKTNQTLKTLRELEKQ